MEAASRKNQGPHLPRPASQEWSFPRRLPASQRTRVGEWKSSVSSLNCSARSNPEESIILLFLAACRGQDFLTGPYAPSGGPRMYHVGVCTAPSPVGLELPRAAAIRISPPGLHTNVRAIQRVGLG